MRSFPFPILRNLIGAVWNGRRIRLAQTGLPQNVDTLAVGPSKSVRSPRETRIIGVFLIVLSIFINKKDQFQIKFTAVFEHSIFYQSFFLYPVFRALWTEKSL